jgi:tetratricopeptide (TPR) repeat protein
MPLNTDDPRLWFDMGVAHAGKGHFEEAISAYRQAVRIRRSLPEAWYNLGVAYGYQRRYREAVEAFREAIALRPDYVKAWFNLGLAYAIQGDRARVLKVHGQLKVLSPAKAQEFHDAVVAEGRSGT